MRVAPRNATLGVSPAICAGVRQFAPQLAPGYAAQLLASYLGRGFYWSASVTFTNVSESKGRWPWGAQISVDGSETFKRT